MTVAIVFLAAAACSDDEESAADAMGLTTMAAYTDGLELSWEAVPGAVADHSRDSFDDLHSSEGCHDSD